MRVREDGGWEEKKEGWREEKGEGKGKGEKRKMGERGLK
jgi:hypothetical protein